MAKLVIRGYSDTSVSSLIVRGYFLAPAIVVPIEPSSSKNNKYLLVEFENRTYKVPSDNRLQEVVYESRVYN